MSRLTGPVICILVLLLSGCGEQGEPAANAPISRRVPDENLFRDQVRALEKAGDVQKTLNKAVARQRRVIEEQAR